ncbi:restriction endonuclease subunit S [Vibrio parahaemolyticus]|uniref:restriction endonuclease subunit S n=1 Tax=Vibrio parahaemolyticus TaxID=670 RepID=UPI00235E166D|nr:restriction endonuclease subunit S [Vibrio parahaemolyticus]HCG7921948.1 restriction endonuclease subunit S [Vibrio parahaemolyticus]
MEWPIKKLSDICENLDSKRVPITKKDRIEGPYPYYGASGVVDSVSDYLFDEDLLLVSEDGANLLARTYPIAFSISGKTWVNNHAHVLRFPSLVSQRFVEYYLNSISLKEYVSGMAQPKLNQKSLNSILIPDPEHNVKSEIVDFLDKAFADIEQARVNTEQNLQNARELFDSYLQQVFSECGEGWKKTTLNELCTKFEYGTSSKSSQEGEVPVIRMGNIQDGRIVMDKLVYSLNEEDNQKYHLNFNDVLFNRTNSAELVGKTAIYKSEERAIFAGYLIRIHRNEKLLNADYLNFYLNSPIARKYGEQVMSQSTNQANISGTKLKTYPISIPVSLEEQQSIVEKISTLKEKVEELEATHKSKLAALDELKQSLLQQAFTGQLTQG